MEDETQGQGGTYLIDPKTGKRKLIEQTAPAPTSETTPEELNDGSSIQEGNINSKS